MRLLGGGDAGRLELPAQSELGELAHRVRQQVDADAQRSQLGGGVDQLRLDARRVQAESGGQAGDPGACDQHPHRNAPFIGVSFRERSEAAGPPGNRGTGPLGGPGRLGDRAGGRSG